MLAKEEFISLIDTPEKVNNNHLESISSLIERYPYFLTARLLKTKGLQNTDAIGYEDFLRTTAAYTPNRETLYHLLMREKLKNNIADVEETDLKEKQEPENVIKEVDLHTKEEIEPSTDQGEKTKITELEQQILEEAVSASLSYELDPDLLEEEEAKPTPEKILPEEDPINFNEKTSFSSWLKKFNHEPKTIAPVEKKEENIDNLIDKFIQNEPRIGESKKEFFSPENVARMSLVEDPDFVTETLAKIYAQQGHLTKAISAFKKLSLKYPEKSTYFAAQIKKLEEQLKQK